MSKISDSHLAKFNEKPEIVVKAPGRVNLIGDHTDYNDGFVLPMAIDRYVWVGISKREDSYVKIYSIDHDDIKRVGLQSLRYKKEDKWANYVKGVIHVLQQHGYSIGGANLTITGNIPEGAGLSSSAALEVAVAYAFDRLFELDIDRIELAQMSQEAENNFVGVKCGIMDQLISVLGREGNAVFIDTRSLDFEYIPMRFEGAKIVITNSNVPRGLVDSEYNKRRSECERCVEILKTKKSGSALRDYSLDDLGEIMGQLPESTRKKCIHVVEENKRVLDAKEAMKKGDLQTFGKLMNRSHESLRDLYEVSCPELDWLVKRAWETDGVYGSRMTGGGFGGCTVTLLKHEAFESYKGAIHQYEKIFGFHPDIYLAMPSSGVEVESD